MVILFICNKFDNAPRYIPDIPALALRTASSQNFMFFNVCFAIKIFDIYDSLDTFVHYTKHLQGKIFFLPGHLLDEV
jgi:hypothetical protein